MFAATKDLSLSRGFPPKQSLYRRSSMTSSPVEDADSVALLPGAPELLAVLLPLPAFPEDFGAMMATWLVQ